MRFIAPTLGLLVSLLLTACVSPVVIDRQSDANLANLQTYRFVSQDEDKPRELIAYRFDFLVTSFSWLRPWCKFDKAIEHLINAKISQCGAEIDRGQGACQISLKVKFMTCAFNQVNFFNQLGMHIAEVSPGSLRYQALDDFDVSGDITLPRLKDINLIVIDMIDALKVLAHANGPGNRRAGNVQH